MTRRLLRALRRRCPRCGSADIFDGWWRLRTDCPRCALLFEREEGYWLGAIAINTGATIAAFAFALVGTIVATWPTPHWGLVSAATIATTAITPVLFYPLSKTVWMAIDLGLRGEPNR
jgi:uncharacterized protein (DUF983 family)